MNTMNRLRTVAFLPLLAILTGCAVGQKFNYSQVQVPVKVASARQTFAVAVLDQRDYVVLGKKSESFVGISRGGFGNPFDVKTASGAPLAADMSEAICRSLRSSPMDVQKIIVKPPQGLANAKVLLMGSGRDRLLLFTVHEWKTDTMARTGLTFDIGLQTFDRQGTALAEKRISGNEVSGASILSAETSAQNWFADKVQELLSDRAIADTLKSL